MVRVDAVRLEPVSLWREVTGELRSPLRSRIAAEYEGRVLVCDLQPGDEVKANQEIASLDPAPANIARDRAKAEAKVKAGVVSQRKAELAQAERELENFTRLRRENSATQTELDRAQTNVDTLRAQIAQAEGDADVAAADLAEAERRVAKMVIRAPFAGRVVARAAQPGEWLSRGDTVMELVNLDRIEAWLDVPESLVDALRAPEATVRVRVSALREPSSEGGLTARTMELEAPVTALVPIADPLSRLVPVRVLLENPGGRLTPGMSVTGLVPLSATDMRLTVHKDAILRDDGGEYVYGALGNKAIPFRLRTRFAVGDRLVVEGEGLFPGLSAIVEGNERLYPTAGVMIQNAPAEQPGATSGGGSVN